MINVDNNLFVSYYNNYIIIFHYMINVRGFSRNMASFYDFSYQNNDCSFASNLSFQASHPNCRQNPPLLLPKIFEKYASSSSTSSMQTNVKIHYHVNYNVILVLRVERFCKIVIL